MSSNTHPNYFSLYHSKSFSTSELLPAAAGSFLGSTTELAWISLGRGSVSAGVNSGNPYPTLLYCYYYDYKISCYYSAFISPLSQGDFPPTK
ncbi:MAG: hypothetical protein Q6356_004705 [Candidatus Wukongarchaeota archaeon]|nr:hypothetical protein [Candidatus Wukongarchaeota archaeon]